jgi:hypothetical protein
MPLIHINLRAGKPEAYRQAIFDSLYRAMREALNVPEDDQFMTMTEHEEPRAFTVDLILRNFPPMDSFVVRRNHPLMEVEEQLDATKIKKKPGAKLAVTPGQALACLKNDSTHGEWWTAFHAQYPTVSDDTFDRRIATLVNERKIFKSEIDGKYTRLR